MNELQQLAGHGDTIKLRDEIRVYQKFPKNVIWEMRGLVTRIQAGDGKIIIRMIVIEAARCLDGREDVAKTVAFKLKNDP